MSLPLFKKPIITALDPPSTPIIVSNISQIDPSPKPGNNTPGVSPAFTATPTPSNTAAPEISSPSPLPALPHEHVISIKGHHQIFSIDCEASAAVDWAAYYGKTINEFEFQSRLPKSDNPEYGFVGSINSPWGLIPPDGYGVYAGPIANLLESFEIPATSVKDTPFNLVKEQISQGNPVMAWIVGSMETSPTIFYADKLGRKVIVAPYEHVVILNGYNDSSQRIRYMSEGKIYEIAYNRFLDSWKILGNMVVIRGQGV